MTPELEKLEQLARSASEHHRGRWTARKMMHAYEVRDANGDMVADVARSVDFIAACDPETVLELLSAVRERDALRDRVAQLERSQDAKIGLECAKARENIVTWCNNNGYEAVAEHLDQGRDLPCSHCPDEAVACVDCPGDENV